MKWFDDWFTKKCKEAWTNSNTGLKISDRDIEMQKAFHVGQAINKLPSSLAISYSPNTQSINFQIYPATGGHVVEVSIHDNSQIHINTNPYKSLHIIPSDKDLGEAISKIITLEMLKK
jgi:hypothetical protein